MELVDMNSLGLFDFIFYPFKSDLPYVIVTNIINIYFLITICCRLIGKS